MINNSKVLFAAMAIAVTFLASNTVAKQDASKVLSDLKPVLDCQVMAVAQMPLDQLKLKESGDQLLQIIENTPPKAKTRLLNQVKYFEKFAKRIAEKGAIDINIVHRIGTILHKNRLVVVRCKDDSSAEAVADHLGWNHIGFYSITSRGNLVLLGWDDAFDKTPRLGNSEIESLATALDASRGLPVRIAVVLSDDQKKSLLAGAPEIWGDGTPSSIRNFESMAVGLDLCGKQLNVKLKTLDQPSARAMGSQMAQSLKRSAKLDGIEKNMPLLASWLSNAKLSIDNKNIEFKAADESFEKMVKAFSEPILQTLKRQRYSEETARVREMALGFLKYEEEHGSFPPPYSINAEGKPMHSWRVLILPYINQRNLFNEFRMNEPWDSDHNMKTAELTPVNYLINDGVMVDGMLHTRILAMTNDNSAIRMKGTKFSQITDGSVSTISVAVGSVEQAVPWTKPVDVTGTAEEISAVMLKANPDGFWVATCDSGVHFVPPKADVEKLAFAFQIDDGNVVASNGDTLGDALAGKDTPDPMFDPAKHIPRWWTDYLTPVPWIIAGKSAD